MLRSQLEHIIRAAASITNEYELVVIGSQSILGAIPDADPELLLSIELDLYPKNNPHLADLIDGSIGEGSPFEHHFGYYAQGVGPDTAILPKGWELRLVKVQNQNTDLKIGWCLDPTDMAASKLAAGRDKDWPFVEAMIKTASVSAEILRERIMNLPISQTRIEYLVSWIESRLHLQNHPVKYPRER